MQLVFREKILISDSFRKIFQHQKYESVMKGILNRSQKVLQHLPLQTVDNQAQGQCDYMDTAGTKYEAKVVFDERLGKLLGEKKNPLKNWVEYQGKISQEFNEADTLKEIEATKMYSIIKDRILTVKEDEIAVLWFFSQVINDSKGSILSQFAMNPVKMVCDSLYQNKSAICQDVMILCPTMDKDIWLLWDYKTNNREFIDTQGLMDLYRLDTSIVVDSGDTIS